MVNLSILNEMVQLDDLRSEEREKKGFKEISAVLGDLELLVCLGNANG